MPRGSPPGARRPTRSARAMARSRTSRCRRASSSTASRARGRIVARHRGRGRARRFLIGGVAGWMARGASAAAPATRRRRSPARRSSAHRLYIGEVRHPIEVRRRREPSAAVAVAPRRHDAARARSRDVRAEAARRPAAAGRNAARPRCSCTRARSGERFTHLLSRRPTGRPQTAFRYNVADESGRAVRWVEGELGYVVSGPADSRGCKSIAEARCTSSWNAQHPADARRRSRGAGRRRRRRHAGTMSRGRSADILARIVGLLRRATCVISSSSSASLRLGQHDAHGGEQIAGAAFARQALALEAEGAAARLVFGGIASSTAPSSVGTRTLPPSTAS